MACKQSLWGIEDVPTAQATLRTMNNRVSPLLLSLLSDTALMLVDIILLSDTTLTLN